MIAPVINYPRTMFEVSNLSGGATIKLPNPSTESGKATIATMVNSGRNANAVVTAQKIGRDQDKTELSWPYMSKEDWEELLTFFDENFFFNFTYYSPVAGSKITRKCYVGDRTYQPYDIDANGNPIAYKECKLNVIDTGEGS